MDRVFVVALTIGVLSRIIMLNLDKKQYPTQPNLILTQMVLAFVASALGALVVPALIAKSYTSITFLSLAAEQFRKVRENRRDSLQNLEDIQLVKRGSAFIEEIARTYEVRNYMCILTSFMTIALHYLLIKDFNFTSNVSLTVSAIFGITLALVMKKLLTRKSIEDIADVREVKISFVDEFIMQVGDLKGITNVGLESERERYLSKGVGIEIIPKDKNYTNASILYDPGQRQAIVYNIYSRMGLLREDDEPAFVPLPRRNPKNESIILAYIPIERDPQKVIQAIKSCPILSSSKGKNLSIKYKIGEKGSV
ncbi:YIEGIA domain-containing protein [Romboutsia sp.]|uniref:YIEGIA domain-containing protein n=1 Tax=Romboutsia sp. TaxID=1965302 RepID=UPI002B675253|nr:YIEGIA domain-containing protein [Romboutsia sp.]HSQ88037.1 YIEGIA domain-containing protein [Romboutsia sp.]